MNNRIVKNNFNNKEKRLWFIIFLTCFSSNAVHSNEQMKYTITNQKTYPLYVAQVVYKESYKQKQQDKVQEQQIQKEIIVQQKKIMLEQSSKQLQLIKQAKKNYLNEKMSASFFKVKVANVFAQLIKSNSEKNNNWRIENVSKKDLSKISLTLIFSNKKREKVVGVIAKHLNLDVIFYPKLKLLAIVDNMTPYSN